MVPTGFYALHGLPERGLAEPPHASNWDRWPDDGVFDEHDLGDAAGIAPLIAPRPVATRWDAVSEFNGATLRYALEPRDGAWCVEQVFSNGGAPDRSTLCVRAGRGLTGTWSGSAGPFMH